MTQDEWKEKFGKRLITVLKEKNMKQSELAKMSGVSSSRVSEYISMKSVPTIFAIVNMADALDMTVEELVDCDELVCK